MKTIGFQVLFLSLYLLMFVVARYLSVRLAIRQMDARRRQQEALEREWKVGIPYDPPAEKPFR